MFLFESIIAPFRTWNHTRLAKRDMKRGPLSAAQKRKLCRKLGPVSMRGVVVNDPEYQTRRDAVLVGQ